MKKILEYKEYRAEINYSEEDKVWHGKVLDITSLIIFDSSDKDKIEEEFHTVIDSYLDHCAMYETIPNTTDHIR